MKKHDILENIKIEKLIFGGSGLATAPDGRRIIISGGAIPDAIVNLRILKTKKNHIEAQIFQTIKKSPLEKEIPSEWQLYGGCKWLPIPYEKQLEIKNQQIHEAFYPLFHRHNVLSEKVWTPSSAELDSLESQTVLDSSVSNFSSVIWHPIIASPESEQYRNKVEFSWGKYISDREWIHDEYRFGFHVQGQFDRIEDCRYCVLATDTVNAIFRDIDIFARNSEFPTYDPKTGEGFWRHLVVREAKKTGEIMLVFSVNSLYEKSLVQNFFQATVEKITSKYPQIASIYFLENTGRADIVTGNPILLFWKETITDELLGLSFEIAPKSFFQVNSLGAEKLYGEVARLLRHPEFAKDPENQKPGCFVPQHDGDGPLVLLDLYAGTGTIGILLARYFEKVYSVELVESASRDGQKNALRNKVSNVEFINKKVEDFALQFSNNKGKADTIIVDPPRDWLHPSAIPHIL